MIFRLKLRMALLLLPLVLSALQPAGADVIINEIMYRPSSRNPLEEYVELFNSGPAVVDLQGWHFTRGINFEFPAVSIPANAYLVVVADPVKFAGRYPGISNLVGGWTGKTGHS